MLDDPSKRSRDIVDRVQDKKFYISRQYEYNVIPDYLGGIVVLTTTKGRRLQIEDEKIHLIQSLNESNDVQISSNIMNKIDILICKIIIWILPPPKKKNKKN